MLKPIVLCSAAVAAAGSLLPSATLAFTTSLPSKPTTGLLISSSASSTTTKLFSETKQDSAINGGGEWSIGAPSRHMVESARKKKVAKEALNKLLERQQRDVQQTLDLLENLDYEKQQQQNDFIFDENFNVTSLTTAADPTAAASSITASVAAGVDYGFISRSEGCRVESIDQEYLTSDARFEGYGPPGNALSLGSQQFMRNLRAMIGEYRDEESNPALTQRQRTLQSKLGELTLNSTAIWDRERARGEVVAPLVIKIPYFVLCYLLDVVFEGRNSFSRFFLLETVARMPYFSYITMLHLYETLGFWRRSADIKRIHFAEEWNEFHHLLIMESLGGDQPFWVRFMAQHSALAYYIALCMLWMLSPSLSYKFSEMLETHAVDTYGQFVDENEEKLKQLPPSLVAVEYYTIGVSDPMFGEYQTASVSNPDRDVRKSGTNLRSLYDVFVAIRNDEGDHVQTMGSCLDPKVAVLSPALESRVLTGMALAAGASAFLGSGGIESLSGVSESLGLNGIEGLEGFSDLADSLPDLDSILMDDSSASGAFNAIVAGLAGMTNGFQELFGAEVEVDDDLGLDLATGGMDGFELESAFEIVKSILVGILELIGLGL
ncbi:hypothetical protein ACHAXR_005137 [Thalassiosira sp. AJA248-18]